MSQFNRTLTLSLCTVIVGILILAPSGNVTAQNLLQNGDFDFDTGGWRPAADAEISFRGDTGSSLDGGSGPGSLELRYFYWNGTGGGPYQVIQNITEGTSYNVTASYFIPSQDNVATGVDILVWWINGDGSFGSYEFVNTYPMEFDTWTRFSGTIIAPGGTVAAHVELRVITQASDTETRPGIALWDDALFTEEGSDEAVQTLFVPAAASVNGLGGTFWSTTGWFSNAIDLPITLHGAFLPPGEDNTARLSNLTELVTIPAHGFAELKDIVGTLGESDVAGGLYLEARASGAGLPAVLAKVTTYTFTPNPTGDGGFGQGLPAAGPGVLNRVVIPGLFKNANQRTNIGILNTSAQTLSVDVEIRDAAGAEVTTATWTLPPFAQRQSSLASIGAGSMNGGTVIITRQSSAGSFRAYTSTVDQKSGDAVYNPGQ